jgi:hypothetical protein
MSDALRRRDGAVRRRMQALSRGRPLRTDCGVREGRVSLPWLGNTVISVATMMGALPQGQERLAAMGCAPVQLGVRRPAAVAVGPQAERQRVDAPGHRKVVQSDQGLWLHCTGYRRKGRFRSHQRRAEGGVAKSKRRPEGRLRCRTATEWPHRRGEFIAVRLRRPPEPADSGATRFPRPLGGRKPWCARSA